MRVLQLHPSSIGNIAEMCQEMGHDNLAAEFDGEGRVELSEPLLRRCVAYLDAVGEHLRGRYPGWDDSSQDYDPEDEDAFLDAQVLYHNDLAEALGDLCGNDFRSRF